MTSNDSSESISKTLYNFFKTYPNNRIPLYELIERLNKRSFGAALLFLALPNVFFIALIPGLSTLFGIPICLISIQMILSRPYLWLPQKITHFTLSKEQGLHIIEKFKSFLEKTEHYTHPRLLFWQTSIGERFSGFIGLILGIIITLPIPFGNVIGGAILGLMAIGIMEKDGLLQSFALFLTLSFLTLLIWILHRIYEWVMLIF